MTKKKKPEPNPIEEAIGDRANPPAKLTSEELQKVAKDVKKAVVKGTILVPLNPSVIPDVPSPQEMLNLEELNRQTEERLQDQYPEPTKVGHPVPTVPASRPDPPPVTKTSSPESPPQEIEKGLILPEKVERVFPCKVEHIIETASDNQKQNEINERTLPKGSKITPCNCPQNNDESIIHIETPAEDIELTALRKYILEDGFVLATVAFHIVSLCAQPMTTPSTTTWDFKDRAMIPDMVLALLNQPGYLEGIWPSLKIVMGSNKGNSAWTAGIATTIAFFDVVRTLPAIEELKNDTEKKS